MSFTLSKEGNKKTIERKYTLKFENVVFVSDDFEGMNETLKYF